MKIYRISSKWYSLGRTLTVYHGTTKRNLDNILQNGFVPFNAKTKLDNILNQHGLSIDKIPEWIWKEELSYRKDRGWIYFSSSKRQAANYASKWDGEFEKTILDNLSKWSKEQGMSMLSINESFPVVITVDAPWEFFESHRTKDEYAKILDRLKKMGKPYSLSDMQFEFWIKNTLPPEYIVKWEKTE